MTNMIEKLEKRVGTMEGTLKAILEESIHQSKILKELFAAQTSNPNDNKKGKNDEFSSKSQDQIPEDASGPSNPNFEAVIKAPKSKRMSTHTQRHEERKGQRQSAEERRREREAVMILQKKEEEKILVDLKENTRNIIEAAQAGNSRK